MATGLYRLGVKGLIISSDFFNIGKGFTMMVVSKVKRCIVSRLREILVYSHAKGRNCTRPATCLSVYIEVSNVEGL